MTFKFWRNLYRHQLQINNIKRDRANRHHPRKIAVEARPVEKQHTRCEARTTKIAVEARPVEKQHTRCEARTTKTLNEIIFVTHEPQANKIGLFF